MTTTFAHEGYGHALFKLMGLPHSHGSIKSLVPNTQGNNYLLEEQINKRENEAGENFDKHYYNNK